MGLMQKSKLFKFFRVVMPHVRKLEARANRKIIFYGMRPKLWWSSLYSKPMEEVCYLSYEHRYWPVAKIYKEQSGFSVC